MLEVIAKVLDRVISILGSLFIYGIAFSTIFEVTLRYILPGVPVWTGGEPPRFMLLWAVALGTPLVIRKKRNLATELLTKRVSEKVRHGILIVLTTMTLVFLAILLKLSFDFVVDNAKTWSIALNLPMIYVNSSMICLFGASLFYSFLDLVEEINSFRRRA